MHDEPKRDDEHVNMDEWWRLMDAFAWIVYAT